MSMLGLLGLLALIQVDTSSDAPSSDVAERLIVRFGVSFDPVLGSALGDDTYLHLGNTFLNGNAALGTRGFLLPTLHTYALGQAAIELEGAPTVSNAEDPHAQRPILPNVHHTFPDGRALLLHLAYAELEGLDTEGLLSHVHLRGGRQLHFGLAPVTFDGGTLGYDSPRFSVAVRGGQRAAVYDRSADDPERAGSDPGLVLGGDARVRIGEEGELTVDIRAEYLHFQRTLGLVARDRLLDPSAPATTELSTDLGRLVIELVPLDGLVITARASLVGPEPSHLQLGVTYTLGRTTFLFDFDQKVGQDLVFGLATSTGITRRDRRSTYETLRLNIPDLQPYSDARASVMFDVADWLELTPTFGVRVVLADDVDRSPYDADRLIWGLLASARTTIGRRGGLEMFGDYVGYNYLRPEGAGGQFRDAAAGGESMVHDVSAGVRYTRRGQHAMAAIDGRLLSRRSISTGVYGFFSTARLASRYLASPVDEVTVGGGADIRWDFSDYVGVSAAYEVARGSSTFADDVGLLHGLRAGVQGRL